MPDTATAIGPVVRMCDDPACHGWDSCPSANPLMGLADNLLPDLAGEVAVSVFTRNLAFAAPKDSAGVARMVPDGALFLLHKGAPGPDGRYRWTAIYGGPEATVDDALAGSPEYEANRDLVASRLRRMDSADG